MQVIKIRFLVPSLVSAVLAFIVLSPVASANGIIPGRSLEVTTFAAATSVNYLVNLGIVVAAFWLVKRAINRASMKRLAIIVLLVTLVGMAIWGAYLAAQHYVYHLIPTFILVSVVEIFILAFLLRLGRLSTLGQGILMGAAMIVVGFFVGLPVTMLMI